MTAKAEALDLLGRPRAIKTLLSLLESPDDAPVSSVLEEIGGSRTTGINRLDELREAGLVVKEAGDNRTIYRLTDEGNQVAQDLKRVTSLLGEIIQKSDNNE